MTGPDRRTVLGGLGAAAGLAAAPRAFAREARWASAPDLPIRVQEIYPALAGDRIYLAGGLFVDDATGGIGVSDRLYSYADGDAAWTEHARLPAATHHPNGVGADGRLYTIGGFNPVEGGAWGMTDAVRIYDPASDVWSEGPALPFAYAETVTAQIGDRIHVATGRRPWGEANARWQDHGDVADHLVLDIAAGTWERAAPAPSARNSAAGALLNGRWHVIAGRTVADGNTPVHEVYDAGADRWEAAAPLPEPSEGPRGSGGLAAATLDGLIHVFGGEWFSDGGGVYTQVWAYDAQADAWSEAGRMPTPRHGLGAVAAPFNGAPAIYTIGGAAQAGGNDTRAAVEVFTG